MCLSNNNANLEVKVNSEGEVSYLTFSVCDDKTSNIIAKPISSGETYFDGYNANVFFEWINQKSISIIVQAFLRSEGPLRIANDAE